jgi:sulfur carrier protein
MKILVNGKPREVASAELVAVLNELGYCNAVIATALNGAFVPINARANTCVTDDDRLEIVAPMQGG